MTAREAAAQLRTTIPVILMWRNRGWLDNGTRVHLTVAGHVDGRPAYRWGDLLRAEAATRRSRRRLGLPPRAQQPYERATA